MSVKEENQEKYEDYEKRMEEEYLSDSAWQIIEYAKAKQLVKDGKFMEKLDYCFLEETDMWR